MDTVVAGRRAARRVRPAPATAPPANGRRFLWLPGDALTLVWTTIGGFTTIVVSYLGVSSTDRYGTQQAWVALGVGAVVLTGIGNAIWLAAGARAVAQRRHRVLERLHALTVTMSDEPVTTLELPAAVDDRLVATATMTRFHRAGCALARGKDVQAASAEEHQAAGRRPCGVCLAGEDGR